ncbi:hypothetical protein SDJN03_24431, partial [Cucurbita argyrosperma subsp. sororia]
MDKIHRPQKKLNFRSEDFLYRLINNSGSGLLSFLAFFSNFDDFWIANPTSRLLFCWLESDFSLFFWGGFCSSFLGEI